MCLCATRLHHGYIYRPQVPGGGMKYLFDLLGVHGTELFPTKSGGEFGFVERVIAAQQHDHRTGLFLPGLKKTRAVIVLLRGDHSLNEAKLSTALGGKEFRDRKSTRLNSSH